MVFHWCFWDMFLFFTVRDYQFEKWNALAMARSLLTTWRILRYTLKCAKHKNDHLCEKWDIPLKSEHVWSDPQKTRIWSVSMDPSHVYMIHLRTSWYYQLHGVWTMIYSDIQCTTPCPPTHAHLRASHYVLGTDTIEISRSFWTPLRPESQWKASFHCRR